MVGGGGKAFLAGGGQKTITLRSQVAHSLARGIVRKYVSNDIRPFFLILGFAEYTIGSK